MAIMSNVDISEYKEIQEIIEDFLLKKKYKFKSDDIIIELRKEILARGFDIKLVDCSFFNFLVLNTIDKFVNDYNNSKLYKIGNFYFPVDYLIYNNYKVNSNNKLLYFVLDNSQLPYFKNTAFFRDIETGEIINKVDKNCFILCGGVDNDRYKTTLQSEVDYKEIIKLFNDFIKEGASREEAINHILNYYRARRVADEHSWGKDFIISKKEEKKNNEINSIVFNKVKKRRKKLFTRR